MKFGVTTVGLAVSAASLVYLVLIRAIRSRRSRLPDIDLPDESLLLYRAYTKQDISREELTKKADEFRARALAVQDYRCIRQGRFLVPRARSHPRYASDVKPGLGTARVVDVGCCLATDLRHLLVDGASVERVFACDLESEFWSLGLELFGDANSGFAGCFTCANVLQPDFADRLAQLQRRRAPSVEPGLFDIAYMGSVLHLFSEADIETALRNVLGILKPGGVLFGSCVGVRTPGVASISRTIERRVTVVAADKPGSEHLQYAKDEGSGVTTVMLRFLHSADSLSDTLRKTGYTSVDVVERSPEMLGGLEFETKPLFFLRFYAVKPPA